MSHEHSHDHAHSHDHSHSAPDHGHTHEILDGPGSYMGREMPIIEGRDWSERAFTVGIGGYVDELLCCVVGSLKFGLAGYGGVASSTMFVK